MERKGYHQCKTLPSPLPRFATGKRNALAMLDWRRSLSHAHSPPSSSFAAHHIIPALQFTHPHPAARAKSNFFPYPPPPDKRRKDIFCVCFSGSRHFAFVSLSVPNHYTVLWNQQQHGSTQPTTLCRFCDFRPPFPPPPPPHCAEKERAQTNSTPKGTRRGEREEKQQHPSQRAPSPFPVLLGSERGCEWKWKNEVCLLLPNSCCTVAFPLTHTTLLSCAAPALAY